MKLAVLAVLTFLLSACSNREAPVRNGDAKSEFLQAVGNDTWASWPAQSPGSSGEWRPCFRVRQELLLKAVQLLEKQEAVGLAPAQVRTFLGTEPEDTNEQPFLLRGFASDNSAARVFVSGKNVSVSSEGLGGLANIRRYPCVAYLGVQPDKVYTMATYDL